MMIMLRAGVIFGVGQASGRNVLTPTEATISSWALEVLPAYRQLDNENRGKWPAEVDAFCEGRVRGNSELSLWNDRQMEAFALGSKVNQEIRKGVLQVNNLRRVETTMEENVRTAINEGQNLLRAGDEVWDKPGTLPAVGRLIAMLITPLMQENYELGFDEVQNAKVTASDLSVAAMKRLYQRTGLSEEQSLRLARGLAPDQPDELQGEQFRPLDRISR